MQVRSFDEFIAIDWSGARGNYEGIAVATCGAGRQAPRLVYPGGRRWSREAIADWLVAKLTRSMRVLVGLDFAFGFPYEEGLGCLGGSTDVDHIFRLWSLIDEKSFADADFGCSSFVDHPDHAHLFWRRSTAPPRWVNRKRLTELVCAQATRTRPDTVYKLIGPRQVGKASITGIRVLNSVRSRARNVAVWPFEAIQHSALVEIYPTLFRMISTDGVAKIRTWPALNQALSRLGSTPVRAGDRSPPNDHETDALISAAGLRTFGSNPKCWLRGEALSARVLREGWIFGVQDVGRRMVRR